MVPGGISLEEVYEADKYFSSFYASSAQIHQLLSLPLLPPLELQMLPWQVGLSLNLFIYLGDREKGDQIRQQRSLSSACPARGKHASRPRWTARSTIIAPNSMSTIARSAAGTLS